MFAFYKLIVEIFIIVCYSLCVTNHSKKGDINMKKIVAIVLCVALLAALMAVSVSALDLEVSNTNTSISYISVFEDFFNFESIFDFFESLFNMLGFTSDLYMPVA